MAEPEDTQSRLHKLLNDDLYSGDGRAVPDAMEYYQDIALTLSKIAFGEIDPVGIAVYSTGFAFGKFTRIASLGDCNGIIEYETNDSDVTFVERIRRSSFEQLEALRVDGYYSQDTNDIGVFYLFGRGEIFGFILVFGELMEDRCRKFFAKYASLVNAILSDQAFSFRMHTISQPLLDPTNLEDFELHLSRQVTDLVTRGFGADGSTLRLLRGNDLEIVASAGELTPDVSKARAFGDLLSGLLMNSPDYDWAAVILDSEGSRDIGGLVVPAAVKEGLRKTGLYSVLISKLGRSSNLGKSDDFGSLSYYFRRATTYSRRDIALFRSFAQKVSAYLSMYYSLMETRDQQKLVELQSRFMVHSEVASLLSHDIWHSSANVAFDSEVALDMFKKGVDRGRLSGKQEILSDIESKLDNLALVANKLHSTASKYKRLQGPNDDRLYLRERVSVLEAISNVEETLKPVLERRGITIIKGRIEPRAVTMGPSFLFEQVLYTLLINSIQAITSYGGKKRQGTIEVSAHVENNLVVVRIVDSGPGISPISFPEIQDVFAIGRTSRDEGTGTGLPTARQVLGSHFAGNLTLSGRRPAVFSITVPKAG